MLQQEQLVGDSSGLACFDEGVLQRERLGVADHAEAADLDLAPVGLAQIHPSSNVSSRSLRQARKRPPSAPSISRWS